VLPRVPDVDLAAGAYEWVTVRMVEKRTFVLRVQTEKEKFFFIFGKLQLLGNANVCN
jgi:hypothetical protein